MDHAGRDFKPMMGWVLCKKVSGGKSEGGLHIPSTAKTSDSLVVIESAPGYYLVDGTLVPTPLMKGDLVYPITNARFIQAHAMPSDWMLVQLHELASYARRHEDRPS